MGYGISYAREADRASSETKRPPEFGKEHFKP